MDIALLEILNYRSPYYFSMKDISRNIIINTPIITLGFLLGQDKLKLTKGIINPLYIIYYFFFLNILLYHYL